MTTPSISTALITVTPLVDGSFPFDSITREIGADMPACDLGGAIQECVSALFDVGVMPHQVEFRVKIEPGYHDLSEVVMPEIEHEPLDVPDDFPLTLPEE